MKDGIICGIVIGMIAGALLYKYNPQAKEIVNKTEEAVKKEVENIKNNVSVNTKLQDALLVLNKMDNAPMDLILDIKHKLKTIK